MVSWLIQRLEPRIKLLDEPMVSRRFRFPRSVRSIPVVLTTHCSRLLVRRRLSIAACAANSRLLRQHSCHFGKPAELRRRRRVLILTGFFDGRAGPGGSDRQCGLSGEGWYQSVSSLFRAGDPVFNGLGAAPFHHQPGSFLQGAKYFFQNVG